MLSLYDYNFEDYINKRSERIKNKYKTKNYSFDIDNISICDKDENFMEMVGYYMYEIFQSKNLDKYLEFDDSKLKKRPHFVMLIYMKFKENEKFKYEKPFKLFIKEYLDIKYHSYEYIIAIKLSELRDEISNFVFTYIFRVEENTFSLNNINKFYQTKEPNNIIIMEHLDGKTFYQFIEDGCNIEDIINIYLQIVLALNAVNQHFEFVHADLHSKNIMVDKLDNEKILTYIVKLNGKIVKIKYKTYYSVKIIDFDLSQIKFKENGKIYSNIYETSVSDIRYLISYVYKKLDKKLEISKIIKPINKYLDEIKNKTYDEILYYLIYESEFNKYLDFTNIKIPKYINCNQYLIIKGGNPEMIENEENKNGNVFEIIKKYITDYEHISNDFRTFKESFYKKTNYITLRTYIFELNKDQNEEIYNILNKKYDNNKSVEIFELLEKTLSYYKKYIGVSHH